jgi:hypothetical protein
VTNLLRCICAAQKALEFRGFRIDEISGLIEPHTHAVTDDRRISAQTAPMAA